jgi:hypothetical protein
MKNVIHHLRTKPRHYRRGVAVGVSAGVTLVLAIIWAVTLPARLDSIAQKNKPAQQAAVSATPLESLKNTLNAGLESQMNQSGQMTPVNTQGPNAGGATQATPVEPKPTTYVSNGVLITDSPSH